MIPKAWMRLMNAKAEPRLSQQLPIWALSLISTLWLAAIAASQVEASTPAAMLALAPHVLARFVAGFLPDWLAAGGRPYRYAGAFAQILSLVALACVHYDWLAPTWLGPVVAALAVSTALQLIGCTVDFREGMAWHRSHPSSPAGSVPEDGA